MERYHLAEYTNLLRTKYPKKTILRHLHIKTNTWRSLNGEQVADACLGAAKAFANIKLEQGARIGIYSPNLSKVLFTEIGAFMMRAVSVPLYATSSPEQVKFVVEDAGIELLFVGEQFQYNNAYRVLKDSQILKRIIVFDEDVMLEPEDTTTMYFEEFLRRGDSMQNQTTALKTASEALASDLAVIMYTSGTTGNSKGVMLHHSNFMAQIEEHENRYSFVTSKETIMSFLPLSHIFEKSWVYFCLKKGCNIAFLRDPKLILDALPVIKPSMMCNVPRFWEKVYMGVQDKLREFPTPIQKLMKKAIEIGKIVNIEYKSQGKKAPFLTYMLYKLFDKTLFAKVRKAIGLNNGKFFPCAGAHLNNDILSFLQSIHIPVVYGYGLTESTATVSSFIVNDFKLGSIGTIIDSLEVKIDPTNNEILLKGPTITKGYYKNDEANKEAFTEDGFFRTGDAGRLEGRTLYYTERLKDLFKTANGKYIAPQMIEGLLTSYPIIEQVAVIADGYKFVSALIYPNWSYLKKKAEERGIDIEGRSLEDLAKDHEIYRIVSADIEDALGSLAQYEKIKRFTLLSEPFSQEKGEMTSTLKIKRKVVSEHFAKEIAEMYKE